MNQKNIQQLMDSFLKIDNYHEILSLLFEKYILEGKSLTDLQDFNEQFAYTFHITPHLLSEFLSNNSFPKLDEFGLSNTRYNSVYKFILKMKAIHGAKYMRMQLQTRDPFMLIGTNINLKNNDTTHNITFIRGDLNSMTFNFNVEVLLATMVAMQQSLNDSLKSGLFILSEDNVNNFLVTNERLINTLQEISTTPDLLVDLQKDADN